ncbi:MAG: AN1-type zinc finger domain-containing protein [Candidatus Thorarchaeota archaeon]
MVNCSLCGKEDLSFTCPYCRGVFCAEHRLPESHGCPGLQKAKDDARRKIADTFTGQYEEEHYDQDIVKRVKPRKERKKRVSRFTKHERRDLLIATILILLVGLAIVGGIGRGILFAIVDLPLWIFSPNWWFIPALLLVFWCSFMLHEMAHKFVSQRYGMTSEFRMTPQGYYLSAVAILFGIPIFGTGTMMTSGVRSMDDFAKSSIAGPLCNLIIAGSLLAVAEVIVATGGVLLGPLGFVLFYGTILNALLGLFNMIPLRGFDGGTVLRWDRMVWAVVTVSLFIILLIGYFAFPFS